MNIKTIGGVSVTNGFQIHKELDYDNHIRQLKAKYNLTNIIKLAGIVIDSINNINKYTKDNLIGLVDEEFDVSNNAGYNPGQYKIKYQIEDTPYLTYVKVFIFKK